jgi:transcriptional regulator with XRE-family HTH domain
VAVPKERGRFCRKLAEKLQQIVASYACLTWASLQRSQRAFRVISPPHPILRPRRREVGFGGQWSARLVVSAPFDRRGTITILCKVRRYQRWLSPLCYKECLSIFDAWRRASSLTLQEVAGRLGTTHTTVLRYEKGEVKVPNGTIRLLAEIYGCTPAELEVDPKDSIRTRSSSDQRRRRSPRVTTPTTDRRLLEGVLILALSVRISSTTYGSASLQWRKVGPRQRLHKYAPLTRKMGQHKRLQ